MSRREHIEQLAAELGVRISDRPVDRYRAALDRVEWVVFLPDWELYEDEAYWVGLHELGHAATLGRVTRAQLELLKHGAAPVGVRGRKPGTAGFTEDEAQAWAWALDQSKFPLTQAAQSSIAWGVVDYASGHGWEPSESFARIYAALGDEPDWFNDVTTAEHRWKLESWARPTWAEIADHYSGRRKHGTD